MSPTIKRVIITALVVLALGTFMYFTAKVASPLLKLVVIFGGFGAMFIIIKGYLFRS